MQGYSELPECLVGYEIEQSGEAVRLTMIESHSWDVPEAILKGGQTGWPKILSSLKSVLETGNPVAMKMEGAAAGNDGGRTESTRRKALAQVTFVACDVRGGSCAARGAPRPFRKRSLGRVRKVHRRPIRLAVPSSISLSCTTLVALAIGAVTRPISQARAICAGSHRGVRPPRQALSEYAHRARRDISSACPRALGSCRHRPACGICR